MDISNLRILARKRLERCWVNGTPLRKTYKNLYCEICNIDCEKCVILSMGYSWRSGWVFLCSDCYRNLNYWKEEIENMNISINEYTVYKDLNSIYEI